MARLMLQGDHGIDSALHAITPTWSRDMSDLLPNKKVLTEKEKESIYGGNYNRFYPGTVHHGGKSDRNS